MANAPRSSFIPKQISGTTPTTVRRKRVFSVMNFVSGVMLIAAILAAGGAFLYKTYLERGLVAQREDLNREYGKFSENEIAEVKAFDAQIGLADSLLSAHASPSAVFDALERTAKSSVQYTAFSYERRPSGGITLLVSGVTDEFGKVSLQWMSYLQNVILADAAMTQIGLGAPEEQPASPSPTQTPVPVAADEVAFQLSADFNASRIPYTPSRPAAAVTEPVVTASSSAAVSTSTAPVSASTTNAVTP